jgi:sRNA-binding protein
MLTKEEIKQILELLRERFPGAFSKKEFLILKKGIDLDICKDNDININRTKLRTFLRNYTGHPGYMKVHVVGANRYDLKGDIVGQVTEEEYINYKKFHATRLKQKRFLKQQQATKQKD